MRALLYTTILPKRDTIGAAHTQCQSQAYMCSLPTVPLPACTFTWLSYIPPPTIVPFTLVVGSPHSFTVGFPGSFSLPTPLPPHQVHSPSVTLLVLPATMFCSRRVACTTPYLHFYYLYHAPTCYRRYLAALPTCRLPPAFLPCHPFIIVHPATLQPATPCL